MTRLDRVINLLDKYDGFVTAILSVTNDGVCGWAILTALRKEKEMLTQELIEHGCRRKY